MSGSLPLSECVLIGFPICAAARSHGTEIFRRFAKARIDRETGSLQKE
jgi:hypothetical protein